ncbi:MAG: flagellar export protein FliJ [Deltaproteobacteria bacterium]|nr:flagellar export protein FliJ [Deltaproteobacteria bacterium]
MQKNVFSLERVLNFRREAEKLRKIEFAVAKREFELAEDKLRREEEAIEKLNLEFMGRQLEGIGALELQLYSDFFQMKKQDITQQREEVSVLDRTRLEKQDTLLEAATDKKIMEELKKQKVLAHEKVLAEKERNFLDEIALRSRGQDL